MERLWSAGCSSLVTGRGTRVLPWSRVAEHEDTGRESVHEAARAHGTYLARTEHPGEGGRAQRVVHHPGVVIGFAEQALAPAVAREDEGGVAGGTGEHRPQVLVGGDGVAHLELDGGAHLDAVADRQGPLTPI